MHLPCHAGARDIERLITDDLKLQPGDIAVTLHQPEPYLIRFVHAYHVAAAEIQGRFQGRGIDLCVRPWHSLTSAFGFRIFYRVKLCLDGILSHVWTSNIVERVIGHRCALQCIITDLVQPADTRHIKLWAWTRDPDKIPKKVWSGFTNRPIDGSSQALVSMSELPPDLSFQGVRYEVFIHLPPLEDYTAVANDLQAAIDNPEAFAPIRRRYDWRHGLVDGSLPTARARYPTKLPRPPQVPPKRPEGNGRGNNGGDQNTLRDSREATAGCGRGADSRDFRVDWEVHGGRDARHAA
jgi:hypothetical protein